METNNKKLASISTLEELDAAIETLRQAESLDFHRVKADYRHVKTFYKPANLFNFMMDKISPAFNLLGMALDAYDRLAEKIRLRRSARKAADEIIPAGEPAQDPVPSAEKAAEKAAEEAAATEYVSE